MASILLTRSFLPSLRNNKTLKLKMFARNNFQCASKHLPNGKVIADYQVKVQQFNLLSILSRYYSTTISTNSKCPSVKSPIEQQANCDNLSETSNPNQSAIIEAQTETNNQVVETNEDCISIPDIIKSSFKSLKPVGDLKETFSDFKISYQKTIYVTKNDEGKYVWNMWEASAMAMLPYSEYTNNKNKDIKAISIKVSAIKGAKKLKKLKNMEFLQVYSAKKQALITITRILTKMKTLEESDDCDFSLMDFCDIKDNKSLKKVVGVGGRKRKYQKTLDGTYKETTSSHPELVCQKFQFKDKNNTNIKYYVFLILETTDSELEPFVGKAFSQKVDQNHQTITTPDAVFNYMLKEHWMNYVSK